MKIPYQTLWEDQQFLMQQARDNMRNHISELPYNVSQAVSGLNRCISMLYDIYDSRVSESQGQRPPSDHSHVMAVGLIKDCVKEKMEILTSQAEINHALDFVEKTKQRIKEEFNQDMEQVIEQDKIDSMPINDAIANNKDIQEAMMMTMTAESNIMISLPLLTEEKSLNDLSTTYDILNCCIASTGTEIENSHFHVLPNRR
jgi:hypothetical protein